MIHSQDASASDKEGLPASSSEPARVALASVLLLAVLWLWHKVPCGGSSHLTGGVTRQASFLIQSIFDTTAWKMGRVLLRYTTRSARDLTHPG